MPFLCGKPINDTTFRKLAAWLPWKKYIWPVHTIKAYREPEVELHPSLILGLDEWAVSLRLEKAPWYPLNRRLGGCHSRSELFGKEKNLFPLPGIQSRLLGISSRSHPTELSWFAVFILLALSFTEEEMSTSHTQAFGIPWISRLNKFKIIFYLVSCSCSFY